MIVTITGSQKGWTPEQRAFMRDVLANTSFLHHGACPGVDQQCHTEFAKPHKTKAWPSNMEQLRCALHRLAQSHVHSVMPPLVRNRRMVDEAHRVYACPKEFHEIVRSGTWATIRYAKKTGKFLTIIWPDGTIAVF